MKEEAETVNRPTSPEPEAGACPGLVERRVRVRFAARFPALCQPKATGAADYWTVARARDISAGGLCLVTRRPFERGVVLALQPVTPRFGHALALPLLRVVHVTRNDEQSWLVGGEFTRPLARKELEALLPDPATPDLNTGETKHHG